MPTELAHQGLKLRRRNLSKQGGDRRIDCSRLRSGDGRRRLIDVQRSRSQQRDGNALRRKGLQQRQLMVCVRRHKQVRLTAPQQTANAGGQLCGARGRRIGDVVDGAGGVCIDDLHIQAGARQESGVLQAAAGHPPVCRRRIQAGVHDRRRRQQRRRGFTLRPDEEERRAKRSGEQSIVLSIRVRAADRRCRQDDEQEEDQEPSCATRGVSSGGGVHAPFSLECPAVLRSLGFSSSLDAKTAEK